MLMFCSYVHVAQCFIPLLVDLDPTKVANLQRFTDILESLFDQVISEGNIHVCTEVLCSVTTSTILLHVQVH